MSPLDAMGLLIQKKPDSPLSAAIVIRWERVVRVEGERQTPASREPGREKTKIFTVRLGC